jgi:hypothetical protein
MTETEQPEPTPYALSRYEVERIEKAVRHVRKAAGELAAVKQTLIGACYSQEPDPNSPAQNWHDSIAMHLASLTTISGALANTAGIHAREHDLADAAHHKRTWRQIWEEEVEGLPDSSPLDL